MGINKAITEMICAVEGGWEVAAFRLGMSLSALQNRVYGKKGSVLQIQHALALQTISDTTLFAEAIAEESGGMFMELPEADEDCDNEELLSKFTQILSDLGELARTHSDAIKDGSVSATERTNLEHIAQHAHRHIQELLTLTFRIYCRPDTTASRVAGLAREA
ncbi:YmfL family putative regulatory protein [Paraburkholderia metrosideri]|uniref:YmfL family putative regulatory protein n=1 Tax=Paraburkholderia metrosideri TaxID=580937 RepID=A0ABW9DVI2_9BURK